MLDPRHLGQRGVHAHRLLHPFDPVTDPCAWPTLAIVDDARLAADRTWTRPVDDKAWAELARQIRIASEEALRTLGPPPRDALAVRRIGRWEYEPLPAFRAHGGVHLRGHVWLAGVPGDAVVEVLTRDGPVAFEPPARAPLGGWLVLHSENAGAARPLVATLPLPALCEAMYPAMARYLVALAARGQPDAIDHVMYALRVGALNRDDVRLDVAIGPAAATVARTLATTKLRQHHRAAAPPPPPPPVHPLDELVAALKQRLVQLGVGARETGKLHILAGEVRPLVGYREAGVALAGDHPWLRAAIAASGSTAALDALSAHVVTVLDVGLTAITEASQLHAIDVLLG